MNLKESRQLIQLGKAKWQEGNIEAAIEAFEESVSFLSEQPPWVYSHLAQGYQKKGELDKAIAAYEKAIALKPEHPGWNFQLAKCFFRQNYFDKAIPAYKKAITLKPEHPSAYFDLGNSLIATGNSKEAIDCLERGISINPQGSDGVYRNICHIVEQQQGLKEAITRYGRLALENPNHCGYRVLLGDLLIAYEKPDKAIACYLKAKELGLVKPWLFRRIENVLLDLDRLDEAETQLQALITEHPDLPDGLEGLARVAMRSRQFDLAVQRWDKVIEHFPEIISAYAGKANALLETGKFDEAKVEFQRLTTQYPDRPEGFQGLANVATQQKQWQEALICWNNCVEKFPERSWFQIYRANILIQLERVEEATVAFTQITTQYPDKPQGWEGLAKAARLSGNMDKALEYCDYLQENFPDFLNILREKEEILIEMGRFQEAIVCLEQAILVNPIGSDAAYNKLCNIIKQQEELKEAITRYQQLALEDPNHCGHQILTGDLLTIDGDFDGAITCYLKAKELGLMKPWLFRRIENVLLDLDRLDEAETQLQALIAEYPDLSHGLEGLARVAMRSRQFDLAIQRWDEVIEHFPEIISAHVGKANALLEIGKFDEAKVEFKKLATQYPDRPEGFQGLANVATQQKQWQEALNCWNNCVEKFPERNWFKLYQANILIQLEQVEEATAIFTQITSEYPDKPEGWEGIAKSARLSGNMDKALKYCNYLQENFPDFLGGYKEKEEILIEMGKFQEANQAFLARPVKEKKVYKRKSLANFPPDLVLPELVGVDNDYSFIEDKVENFISSRQPYTLPVSIIIPVYNRHVMLAKTLAALTHQTYPLDLIEVVVVDDGSSDEIDRVIRKYEQHLNLIYTRQADKGYRLSAARNLGARTAKHDYLITIDCDILPYPKLVESYMKFFHVTDRAILIGHRRYVCTDNITDDEILADVNIAIDLPSIATNNEVAGKKTNAGESYDWRFPTYVRTNYKKEQKWAFNGFCGGNEAHPRKAIDEAGEYDEDFQDWGAEDNEMGYRFYNAGYYFIPVMDAMSLHQEPPQGKNETDRQAGQEVTTLQLVEKCPAPIHRKYEQGRFYKVPKVSIYIPVYNQEKYIKQAVDSALNQTYTDLEVCICDDGSTDKTLQVLQDNYQDNPRVRWLTQTNGGISSASNTAVRMCRGIYVGQLDSDDFLKSNAVELAVNYLDNNEVGFVCSSTEIVDRSGDRIRGINNSVEFSRESFLLTMLATHFRMFRKRDWCRTSGFDESLSSAVDYDIYLKLSEVNYFHHIDSANYCYRWHGENTSIVGRREQESNHILVINKALSRLGLGEEWEAISENINNPRDVTLIRKNTLE